jgi:hypothetical protein
MFMIKTMRLPTTGPARIPIRGVKLRWIPPATGISTRNITNTAAVQNLQCLPVGCQLSGTAHPVDRSSDEDDCNEPPEESPEKGKGSILEMNMCHSTRAFWGFSGLFFIPV